MGLLKKLFGKKEQPKPQAPVRPPIMDEIAKVIETYEPIIKEMEAKRKAENPHLSATEKMFNAIHDGHLAPVKWVLATGYKPESKLYESNAIFNNAEILDELLKHGLDANAPLEADSRPLLMAIIAPECVKVLLKHGADVSYTTPDGFTALTFAQNELKEAASLPELQAKIAETISILEPLTHKKELDALVENPDAEPPIAVL